MLYKHYLWTLVTYTSLLSAQVVLDGTLGATVKLEGPHFEIKADYGKSEGGNLFHSFSQFDLNKEQSATFTGPNNIENIISRITSHKYSVIDGIVRTTIPNAELYLINPQGFIFGPNAKLDVQGSVHISTANQIKLGQHGLFETQPPYQSILVSAPPSAFGFLETSPATITVQQSQMATGPGKAFSLVGGEIQINSARLRAISGRINLLTTTQAVDLPVERSETKDWLGKIVIDDKSSIDVGKEGAGDIYIRSGELVLRNSDITANTSASKNGGIIQVEVGELRLSEGSSIDSRTFGPGQGGQIIIKVSGSATLSENSIIQSSTLSTNQQAGDAGNILLEARCLNLAGSSISTATAGPGQGGDINIAVNEAVSLINSAETPSIIEASSEPQAGKEEAAGNAGRIHIKASDLKLSGRGSKIDNSTLGAGLGGNINLKIHNWLNLTDQAFISADSQGTGEAGSITLNTRHLNLHQGSISTAAKQAQGGNIIINARQSIKVTDSQLSATVSGGHGNGGNLLIGNPRFFTLTNSQVIANAKAGHGGLVLIVTTPSIQNSSITAASEEGLAGEVKIDDIYKVDISSLPVVFLDASGLIKKRCQARTMTDLSSFVIVGKSGLPRTPEDLQFHTPSSK